MRHLFAIAALSICAGWARAGTVMSLTPSSALAQFGDTFSLSVNLVSTNTDISGFDFAVQYDPLVLQALSVTEDGFFAQPTNGCCFPTTFDFTSNPGTISGITDSTSNGPDTNANLPGGDTLVSIAFQVVGGGTTTVALTCDAGDTLPCLTFPMLSDSSFNAIGVDTLNSSTVTVLPEPSTAVLSAAALAWLARMARKRAGVFRR